MPRQPGAPAIACATFSTSETTTVPNRNAKTNVAATAKLLVVLLAFAWGFNWIAAAVALQELSPWTGRFAGSSIGAATLLAAALLTGHSLKIPRGEYIHIMI